jgi:hypothetical protein
MLKKSSMTFSTTRSEKCDFHIPYIFNGWSPLKKTVHPCTGKQAAENRVFNGLLGSQRAPCRDFGTWSGFVPGQLAVGGARFPA